MDLNVNKNVSTSETNPVTDKQGSVSYNSQSAADETEINLAELLLTYIKKWLLLCAVSCACTILVFLFIRFVLNKNSTKNSISFTFSFPGSSSELYPDGSTFKMSDLISEKNITETLESNYNLFKDYTSDGVIKNLVLTREYVENSTTKEKIYSDVWTFTGKTDYFGSSNNFKMFVSALCDSIVNKIKTMSQTAYYYTYLDSYDSSTTFQQKLNYLTEQKNYIIAFYDKWLESYGQQYSVDSFPVLRYRGDVETAVSANGLSNLKYELNKRQYTYKATADEAKVLRIQIEILEDEFEDNKKKITALMSSLDTLRETEKSTSTDISGKSNEAYFYENIASLTERQVDIEREISNLETRISNINLTAESAAYLAKLENVRSILAEQTAILRKVSTAVYSDKTIYTFDTSTFATTGSKNPFLFSAAAFVLVYLIMGFLVYIIDSNSANKKK